MSEHSTHCKDPHCCGCSCTPDCDYWDEEPNVMAERERIIKIMDEWTYDNFASWNDLIRRIKGENE